MIIEQNAIQSKSYIIRQYTRRNMHMVCCDLFDREIYHFWINRNPCTHTGQGCLIAIGAILPLLWRQWHNPEWHIIAQVYRLSAVQCQVTRYSQRIPGYLTMYSQCQPIKSLLTKRYPIRLCLSTDVRHWRTLFPLSTWWLQQAFLKA